MNTPRDEPPIRDRTVGGFVQELVSAGIHHRFGPVRKATRLLMHAPRTVHRWRDSEARRSQRPPVLANSVPKSGTHLLEQVVASLPGSRGYGRFLESMTASYVFRERSVQSTTRFIDTIVSGEVVRAHLHHAAEVEHAMARCGIAHYLIIRDPRDVAVSEAHYLRSMNRWHVLHPHFRAAKDVQEAVTLAITGLDPRSGIQYPDIARRHRRFTPWLGSPAVHVVRFEDLTSERRDETISGMVRHFARHGSGRAIDVEAISRAARDRIAPALSHTFREGRSGGWRDSLTSEQKSLFRSLAGDLLVELGYEDSEEW